jgi:hypothetical protein
LLEHPYIVESNKVMGVPEVTIRHGMEWLENQGLAARTRRGAPLGQQRQLEPECAPDIRTYTKGKLHIEPTPTPTAGVGFLLTCKPDGIPGHAPFGRYQSPTWLYP